MALKSKNTWKIGWMEEWCPQAANLLCNKKLLKILIRASWIQPLFVVLLMYAIFQNAWKEKVCPQAAQLSGNR